MREIETLRHCPLFSEVGNAALADLLKGAVRSEAGRGEMIFSEGDPAEALYILASGRVDLVKSSADGSEQFVRWVRPGETFAEAAVFAGATYPATAVARQDSRLIVIEKRRFVAFLRSHPDAALAMLAAMARLLRHLNGLLAELSLASVESRLAAWLLRRMREAGAARFAIGIPKKELAFRLGTVPETLSRNLRRLVAAGAIRVQGAEIEVRDAQALEGLSGL